MKKKLFVDMDGTLCEWRPCIEIEALYEKGYFATLRPQSSVVRAIRDIYSEQKDIVDVYILSAYLPESKYAVIEKNEWLDTYIPQIKKENRIFVPVGVPKPNRVSDIFHTPFGKDFILIDDYSVNLFDWSNAQGTGIKLLNGLNGNNGKWKGYYVESSEKSGKSEQEAADDIKRRVSSIITNMSTQERLCAM